MMFASPHLISRHLQHGLTSEVLMFTGIYFKMNEIGGKLIDKEVGRQAQDGRKAGRQIEDRQAGRLELKAER